MRLSAHLIFLSIACAACSPPAPAAPWDWATVAPLPDDLKARAPGNNAFAFDLFAQVRGQKGNLAFSPFNVATTLTIAWAGARGETAAQIQKVLHLDLDGTTDPVSTAGRLTAAYRDPALQVTARFANVLFMERYYDFQEPYFSRLGRALNMPVVSETMAFRWGPFDTSRQVLNTWIADATQDQIQDLIPPGSVDKDMDLVLAGASYFHCDWMWFSERPPRRLPFHVSASETKDVHTPNRAAHYRFAATDGVKLLELPYESGGLRMTVVLPDQQDGLDAVEARLSPETFDAWTSKLSRHSHVHIELTPFEIDPTSSLRLDEPLKALGMPVAFDRNKADFSGVTKPDRHTGRPYLSGVFHKVRIKLDAKNPEGPTWAPASNVDTRVSADPIMRFDAMRPYLFFLRDVRSGMILFMGRVSDPTAK
jgi:serpin B